MDQLWAPWRMAYLESGATAAGGCFLCALGRGGIDAPPAAAGDRSAGHPPHAAAPDDALDIVIWRGVRVYALLNAYPYANGHVMVAPYAHEGALDALDDPTAAELMAATRLIIRALRQAYQPQGFNVGANLGVAAGAGFGDHVHLHIVPRWGGDTNFMTTTGQARVIPEALADTAERLRAAVAVIAGEA